MRAYTVPSALCGYRRHFPSQTECRTETSACARGAAWSRPITMEYVPPFECEIGVFISITFIAYRHSVVSAYASRPINNQVKSSQVNCRIITKSQIPAV
jgi:hypothetical protein